MKAEIQYHSNSSVLSSLQAKTAVLMSVMTLSVM